MLLLVAVVLITSSCDRTPQRVDAPPVETKRASESSGERDQKTGQMAFLNRIREADPQHHTIDRALLNEHNELGLVLDHTVELNKIPALMRTILTQMAKEFPGRDLDIVAYAPTSPPRKIGTAHLDSRTRDMSYNGE